MTRHPERISARAAVAYAIRSGRLPRPQTLHCVDCGRQAQEYDHYLGYDEEYRLAVQPLCIGCHRARPSLYERVPRPPRPKNDATQALVVEKVAITVMGYRCTRCPHEWVPQPNATHEPKVCPKCKSPYWSTPRRRDMLAEPQEK